MANPLNQEALENICEAITSVNDGLAAALPLIEPELDKLLAQVGPLVDKFMGGLYCGKNFDSLIVMGMASHISRSLITSGVDHLTAARQSVEAAKLMVKLSRE